MGNNIFKSKLVTGLALGVGAAMLAPKFMPVLAEAAKPLVKGIMKGSILLIEKGKEIAAEASEAGEDWWAEVKAEMAEEQSPAGPSSIQQPTSGA